MRLPPPLSCPARISCTSDKRKLENRAFEVHEIEPQLKELA